LKKAREWKCPEVPGKLVAYATVEPGKEAAAEGAKEPGLDTIVTGEWGPWDFRSGEPKPKARVPGGLLAGAKWEATWFSWKDGPDPRKDLQTWLALSSKPVERATMELGGNPWGGSDEIRRKVGNDRFGLVATTTLDVREGGKHRLTVT